MQKLINKINELGLSSKNVEIHKQAYNGYYVICSDKEKETELNNFLKYSHYEQILTKK